MKNVKLIGGVLFLLGGVGSFFKGEAISGLLLMLLGICILPAVSSTIEKKFAPWQIKGLRYGLYVVLFLSAFLIAKSPKNRAETVIVNRSVQIKPNQHNTVKTCNYGGDKFPLIPGLIAADVYLNFEKIGFEVDKQIKNDHTSILCTLSEQKIKYTVTVDGCSPDDLIRVTASVVDYSGSNQKDIKDFFGYVATLQYKGAEPERAKQWVKDNINNGSAETTIGSVKFKINLKTQKSKILTIIAI